MTIGSIGSILLGLALLGLVGLYVARPLLKTGPRSKQKLTTYQALTAQKEAILTQIRSLDFDNATGKLTDADYQKTREEFMVSAEAIFRQLDELEENDGTAELVDGERITSSRSDLEIDIETAVARRRTQSTVQALESSVTQSGSDNGKTRYCPECGRPTDPDDKFCANCGQKLLNPQHA